MSFIIMGMIITCVEKDLPIFSSLQNRSHDYQILKFQSSSEINIPYFDICLIDVTADVRDIIKILKNKNTQSGFSPYILIYNTFTDLESFFASYKDHVTLLHFEELVNNPSILYQLCRNRPEKLLTSGSGRIR